jgi:peptide/nickel transport system substrate-binding protein
MRSVKRWTVALLLTLLACGRGERPAPGDPSDDSTPRAGGTLLRRLEIDIATLNPVLATSRYDRMVSVYLFTPLINLDVELRPVPGLATSWEVAPDGKLYTFHLDPRATYSDGKPVRAADVVFTLKKIIDPQSEALQIASGFELLDVARTRAVDDRTLEVGFREGLASQLIQFNNVLVIPEHVYGSVADFKTAFEEKVVGSGPYTLVRRVPGKEVVVERRKDYWGEQKPYVQSVVFKAILNDITAWNAARIGEVDETMVPSDLWLREKDNPANKRRLDFLRFYSLAYNYIGWNARNPLFHDKRIRRALGMCLDTRSIILNLYGGTARAMNGHFLPEQWAYNPEVTALEYDPTAAKQIFTSLGWLDTNGDGVLDKDGRPFKFELTLTAGSAQTMAIAQLYQATLKQVGIQMDVITLDGAAAIQRILAGNYEAAYLSWDLDPDPDPFPLFHSTQFPPRGQNFVYYSNAEADRLIDAGRRELDTSKRTEIYRELHAVLAEDQPYTWVNQPSLKWVVNRRVQGAKESKGWGLFLWYPGEFDWWVTAQPVRAAAAKR